MVKIRLARRGRKKSPSYRIVAVDSRRKRGALLEDLGYYDPISKDLDVDVYLMNNLIDDGAQFSHGLKRILSCYLKPKIQHPDQRLYLPGGASHEGYFWYMYRKATGYHHRTVYSKKWRPRDRHWRINDVRRPRPRRSGPEAEEKTRSSC
jgi:small subunit ribosomal protein S16